MKCFADLGQGKGCHALTKKKCDDCSFYKTKEQVELEHKRTQERLKAIGRFEGKVVVSIFS